MQKTICELFAGVGGFRLGFDRLKTGWETTWFSQWEPGARTQWAHDCYVQHFGDCEDLRGEFHTGEDISEMDKDMIPDHTLLVGGFPCQDISAAGTGRGLEGERSGLWREFARVLREIRPGYVFVENSPMLVGRGLGRVLGDLAALGYAARWNVLSAAAVGALHERERIWITAMLADRDRKRQLQSSGPVGKIRRQARDGGDSVADAEGPRLEGWGADAGRAAQPQSRRDGPTGEGGGDGRLPAAMTPAPPATPNAADTLPHSQP